MINDGCVFGGSLFVVDVGFGFFFDIDVVYRFFYVLGGARCLNGYGFFFVFDLESTVMTLGFFRSFFRSVVFVYYYICLFCEGEEIVCGRGRGGLLSVYVG